MTHLQNTVDISTATKPAFQVWMSRAWATMARWLARSRSRDELALMNERMLLDIGRTRAEAMRESGKHFWER